MSRKWKIASLCVLALVVFAGVVGTQKDNEAHRLGFEDAAEMATIQAQGWHTKYQYIADETAEATKKGFASMDEFEAAKAAGYPDKASYDAYLAQKQQQEAQQRANADTSGNANQPAQQASDTAGTSEVADDTLHQRAVAACSVYKQARSDCATAADTRQCVWIKLGNESAAEGEIDCSSDGDPAF